MTLYQVLRELQIALAVMLGACPVCRQPVTLGRLAAFQLVSLAGQQAIVPDSGDPSAGDRDLRAVVAVLATRDRWGRAAWPAASS